MRDLKIVRASLDDVDEATPLFDAYRRVLPTIS
jgi:hypothetical protein